MSATLTSLSSSSKLRRRRCCEQLIPRAGGSASVHGLPSPAMVGQHQRRLVPQVIRDSGDAEGGLGVLASAEAHIKRPIEGERRLYPEIRRSDDGEGNSRVVDRSTYSVGITPVQNKQLCLAAREREQLLPTGDRYGTGRQADRIIVERAGPVYDRGSLRERVSDACERSASPVRMVTNQFGNVRNASEII